MNSARTFYLGLAVCSALLALMGTRAHAQFERPADVGTRYELVIRGGRVMDPESELDAIRNIGITDGMIASVSGEPLVGRTTIDATGLVVAPGFSDTDGFTQNAKLQVRDGVTTVFDIREGTSDVARWYAERDGTLLINFGVGVGYTRIRSDVMGETLRARGTGNRRPSETQIAEILRRLERGFDEGAVALGMGMSGEADPTGWEHVEAFRIAAGAQAHVVAILRDENWSSDSNIPAYLSQMVGAAALSGAAIHIPHLNSSAGPHTPRLLQMITWARARGLKVTAETAPYLAGMIRIYPGEIASHGSDATLTGRGRGLPATSGIFSRALGHYVRERRVLSLMEALRKMTLMPAQRFEARVPAQRNKGRIRVGADADIVLFDADRIIDRATFQQLLPSEGVRYVLVNGVLVVRDGVIREEVFAGRPVRAPVANTQGRK